jgi:hypothetical protein
MLLKARNQRLYIAVLAIVVALSAHTSNGLQQLKPPTRRDAVLAGGTAAAAYFYGKALQSWLDPPIVLPMKID